MKFLVFTTDIIPMPGLPTSGTALRTFGLIEGLRCHGHEVVVSVPQTALHGFKKSGLSDKTQISLEQLNSLESLSFNSENQNNILARENPDVIICGHWPAMALKVRPSQMLVVDLAGPHLLERHYQGSPGHTFATLGKLGAIATADAFIVSGPSQRNYFLSFMVRAGFREVNSRVVEISMPLNPVQPKPSSQIDDQYPRFIFGGVFLPWQDPSWALNSLGKILVERSKGILQLIGGKHPHYNVDQGQYGELFSKLSENPFVEVSPLLPFDEFRNKLSTSDVAIDLMSWNLERQLAVTIRSTTYLWAGLPVIYNNYADLGRLIDKYNAGWTLAPEDHQRFSEITTEIFENPSIVRKKSLNALRLAREHFSWDKAVTPLLHMIESTDTLTREEYDIVFDAPETADFPLLTTHPCAQTFTCRDPGMYEISVKVATHGRPIAGKFDLALYAANNEDFNKHFQTPDMSLIAKRQIPASQIYNNDWLQIRLDSPLLNSAGQQYVLEISTQQDKPLKTIYPWFLKFRPYPLGELVYGNQTNTELSLCIRTRCSFSRLMQLQSAKHSLPRAGNWDDAS